MIQCNSAAESWAREVEMLERNYSFAIEDLEDEGLKPAAGSGFVPGSSLLPAGVLSCGPRER
jgi:hypothetical protein